MFSDWLQSKSEKRNDKNTESRHREKKKNLTKLDIKDRTNKIFRVDHTK